MSDSDTPRQDTFLMPTPQSHARLERYCHAAAAAAFNPDFPGCVLLSLIFYVDDAILDEALADALRTFSGGTS